MMLGFWKIVVVSVKSVNPLTLPGKQLLSTSGAESPTKKSGFLKIVEFSPLNIAIVMIMRSVRSPPPEMSALCSGDDLFTKQLCLPLELEMDVLIHPPNRPKQTV